MKTTKHTAFCTPKSVQRAEAIQVLAKGRTMTAGQIAQEMNCSIQSLTRYLQPMIKVGMLYSAGRQREGNQRGCPLYTASVELSRHPSEILALTKPKREPRPKKEPAKIVPRRDPLTAMFFGARV